MLQKKALRLSILAAAVAIVGGGLFWAMPSDAALPIITNPIDICNAQAEMIHFMSLRGGPVIQIPTTGSITAKLGPSFQTADGRQGQEVTVTGLTSVNDKVDGVGSVDIEFDASRPPVNSTIIANQQDSRFPATQRMSFFITVTVNGETFRSIDPVTLVSTNVTSTPPATGTVFNLPTRVELESLDKPGEVAMTLEPDQAAVIQGHTKG